MFILEVCNDVNLLNILTIIKLLVRIVTIVVPVVLTIVIMLDILKTITSQEVDNKKLTKSIIPRIIAAVVVFLVPYIIDLAIGLIPGEEIKWTSCWENAEKTKTAEIALQNANCSLNELSKVVHKDGFDRFNKSDYNNANAAYEKARVDIKLLPKEIPDEVNTTGYITCVIDKDKGVTETIKYSCKTKDECEEKLNTLKKEFK